MQRSGATGNADQIAQLLEQLLGTFDMTRRGSGADSLGKDLVKTTAQGIIDRTAKDRATADGEEIEPNRGEYGARKERAGKPVGVGLAPDGDDRMLSLPQVVGEVEVTPDRVTMTYGKSTIAKRKAQWFTAGSNQGMGMEHSGALGQPERPFYGLDETIEGQLVELLEDHAKRYIEDLKSGGGAAG